MHRETDTLQGKAIHHVQHVIVTALQMLTMVIVVVATIALFQLFWRYISTYGMKLESVGDLLPLMQRSFAGILVVVIGLELLETLQAYFTHHHVRIEVILVVAIIAVGRHVIQIDFEHTEGSSLIGIAALLVALIAGYVAVRRSFARVGVNSSESQDPPTES
jgi:uncharacterized membrane protein (DUF373 family)